MYDARGSSERLTKEVLHPPPSYRKPYAGNGAYVQLPHNMCTVYFTLGRFLHKVYVPDSMRYTPLVVEISVSLLPHFPLVMPTVVLVRSNRESLSYLLLPP